MRKQFSDLSDGEAFGVLEAGRYLWTDVEDDRDDPYYTRGVYLHGGDVWCADCRERIDPEDFGPMWANVIANMKLKHGDSWCHDCFSELDDDQPQETNDTDAKTGRTFD